MDVWSNVDWFELNIGSPGVVLEELDVHVLSGIRVGVDTVLPTFLDLSGRVVDTLVEGTETEIELGEVGDLEQVVVEEGSAVKSPCLGVGSAWGPEIVFTSKGVAEESSEDDEFVHL